MSIMETITENVLESGATGLVGAAVSKFVLKRESNVDVFNMFDAPEWALDGLLLIAESALADVAGEWAIPQVEQWLLDNDALANAIKQAAPPGFTGLWHAGVKIYGLDRYNTVTQEFLLGAGSKLAGNAIAKMF